MRTHLKKWGNSLALRIPKAFAIEIGLKQDSPIELSLVNDQLVIKPVAEIPLTLEQLLAQVTEDNLHEEIKTGESVGKEVW